MLLDLGWEIGVREGSVWEEYCVGKWKGEKKGGEERSEADRGSCSCFAGGFSIKNCILVSSRYQER